MLVYMRGLSIFGILGVSLFGLWALWSSVWMGWRWESLALIVVAGVVTFWGIVWVVVITTLLIQGTARDLLYLVGAGVANAACLGGLLLLVGWLVAAEGLGQTLWRGLVVLPAFLFIEGLMQAINRRLLVD